MSSHDMLWELGIGLPKVVLVPVEASRGAAHIMKCMQRRDVLLHDESFEVGREQGGGPPEVL